MLLNSEWVNNEIKEDIKRYLENESENTTTQNLWGTAKAVLRGKFTAWQAYLKKQEKSQINNLTFHLKEPEKEQLTKPKVSRRKEIKIRAEINDIQPKKNNIKGQWNQELVLWKDKQDWQTFNQTHQEKKRGPK